MEVSVESLYLYDSLASMKSIDAIEFLRGRLYLGAYASTPSDSADYVYFTIDDSLPYNNFNLDFGPLHLASIYRFAVALHSIMNSPQNARKAVVLYSSPETSFRTNAACILCCYMVLVQGWTPHQVLQPISQIDPAFMGFRDAGYSHCDFEISIQDVVYGMWRAKEAKLVDIKHFNVEEYENYELVEEGDLNILANDFIPFASPKQSRAGAPLNAPFKKVLGFFKEKNVQLVVRLNSHLYDKNEFTKRGMKHVDMIFDDGTCPSMEFVQKFIGAAKMTIERGGKVAVHCKAGLGRTGCLIGAYLIYTYGFTANECIAFMRVTRPGMVVGPQQHWLYLHQNDFREWKYTTTLDTVPDESIGGLSKLISLEELRTREAAECTNDDDLSENAELFHADKLLRTPIKQRKISENLNNSTKAIAVPQVSPGQPRKYRQLENAVQAYAYSDEEEEYTSMINHSTSSPVKPKEVYTKTTTTTTTTTIKKDEPAGSLKLAKQRKALTNLNAKRVVSSDKVIGSVGVRKTSQNGRKSLIM